MSNFTHLKKISSVKINSTLIWMDLEMSGLNPEDSVILEIATIITDNELNIIAEGPNLVINQPEYILVGMDDWNKQHHGASGLIDRVRNSNTTLKEAEDLTLKFVRQHTKKDDSPICGNTIGQDRRFIRKYMPELNDWLHYRSIDVSSIKEVIARWFTAKYSPPLKKGSHMALTDIRESIEELRYYREHFFTQPE